MDLGDPNSDKDLQERLEAALTEIIDLMKGGECNVYIVESKVNIEEDPAMKQLACERLNHFSQWLTDVFHCPI